MQDMHVSKHLQTKVRRYYNLIWRRTRGMSSNVVFEGLPLSLQGEVTLHLYGESLRGVSRLKHCVGVLVLEC